MINCFVCTSGTYDHCNIVWELGQKNVIFNTSQFIHQQRMSGLPKIQTVKVCNSQVVHELRTVLTNNLQLAEVARVKLASCRTDVQVLFEHSSRHSSVLGRHAVASERAHLGSQALRVECVQWRGLPKPLLSASLECSAFICAAPARLRLESN